MFTAEQQNYSLEFLKPQCHVVRMFSKSGRWLYILYHNNYYYGFYYIHASH